MKWHGQEQAENRAGTFHSHQPTFNLKSVTGNNMEGEGKNDGNYQLYYDVDSNTAKANAAKTQSASTSKAISVTPAASSKQGTSGPQGLTTEHLDKQFKKMPSAPKSGNFVKLKH